MTIYQNKTMMQVILGFFFRKLMLNIDLPKIQQFHPFQKKSSPMTNENTSLHKDFVREYLKQFLLIIVKSGNNPSTH